MTSTSSEAVEITKRTGGPQTEEGKATSALNALKHGIRGKTILESERDAYEAHHAELLESLQPQGYLEERLTERIALTFWRLRRLELWEAARLSHHRREAREKKLYRNDRLDNLLSSFSSRRNLSRQPVNSLDLGETFQELERLTFRSPAEALSDWPGCVAEAEEKRVAGEALQAFYNPEKGSTGKQPKVTVKMLKSLSEEAIWSLCEALKENLDEWEVNAEDACKAVLGASCRAEDIEGWEAGDWEWQPQELPGLWRFYGEQWKAHDDGTALEKPHLVAYRAGGDLIRKAERILALGERLSLLLAEREAAAALLLPEDEVQKSQRYEAHLERILYRALHELEAMQERRKGGQAPLARLEVNQ